jgi:hypothetical protein
VLTRYDDVLAATQHSALSSACTEVAASPGNFASIDLRRDVAELAV